MGENGRPIESYAYQIMYFNCSGGKRVCDKVHCSKELVPHELRRLHEVLISTTSSGGDVMIALQRLQDLEVPSREEILACSITTSLLNLYIHCADGKLRVWAGDILFGWQRNFSLNIYGLETLTRIRD